MGLATPQPVAAATATCGTLGNYFEGVVQNQVTYDVGVRGTINMQSAALCTSDSNQGTNFSTPWVMTRELTPRAAYMQSGYMHRVNDCVRYFTEHDRDGSNGGFPFRRTLGGCIPNGDNVVYTVVFDSACTCNRMGYSIVVLDSTEYNIYHEWSSTRNDYLGETTYQESDQAGTTTQQVGLQGFLEQRPLASTFQNNSFPVTEIHQVARYHHQSLNPISWALWTAPL